jgi:hypothetical protein
VGRQPDLGTEMLGIGDDNAQRLGCCGEPNAVYDSLCQPFGTRRPLALRALPVVQEL